MEKKGKKISPYQIKLTPELKALIQRAADKDPSSMNLAAWIRKALMNQARIELGEE